MPFMLRSEPSCRPETLAQAEHWQRRNREYVRAGLCLRCAAQAAWGHQLGFTRVHPPCAACAPVVASLPAPAAGGWRKLGRSTVAVVGE